MCRLAVFPARFSRKDAIEVLINFFGHNKDGTGSAYIKHGQFVINKWPKSLDKVLKSEPSFLSHMPCDSLTIVHLRAASHGATLKVNTHPFQVGNWCFAHNGIFSEYNIARLALGKTIKLYGDTDSEVAAHLLNIAGPKKFTEEIDSSGVFLALNIDGSLWAMKTSGDLVFATLKKSRILIASELDCDKFGKQYEVVDGWYKFDKYGRYLKHKKKKSKWDNWMNDNEFGFSTPILRSNISRQDGVQPSYGYYNYMPGSRHYIME